MAEGATWIEAALNGPWERQPGSEGATTVKASAGSPPKRAGSARWGDDVEELEHGAGPAVRKQQRQRRRSLARHVQEVQVDAVERHDILGKGVEPGFLRTPIKAGVPVMHEFAQIAHIRAVGPRRPGRLVREARACEALAQVGQRRFGDVQGERRGFCSHGAVLPEGCPGYHTGRDQDA